MTPPAKHEDTDVLQRARFRDWVKRITSQLRAANKWTMDDIAARAEIHRDTIYAWMRKGDEWSGGKPKSATVMKFCANLDLEPMEPFAILGWLPQASAEPQTVLPQMARDLARFLLDPNVDADEKRVVETTVSRMLGPYRRGT